MGFMRGCGKCRRGSLLSLGDFAEIAKFSVVEQNAYADSLKYYLDLKTYLESVV